MLVLGPIIGGKIQKGATEQAGTQTKEANLLCGDAIINFKTIQSFGHNDLIVKKYEELFAPVKASTKSTHIKTGLAFGLSQFGQYTVFAGMFYAAGMLMKADPTIKAENLF